MKRTPIKPISKKQAQRNKEWNALVEYLISHRAGWRCEIPLHEGYGGRQNLQGHHIIKRSQGGPNDAGNCLIACGDCHAHYRYGSGIPISAAAALILTARNNEEHNIDGELTGADLLKERE